MNFAAIFVKLFVLLLLYPPITIIRSGIVRLRASGRRPDDPEWRCRSCQMNESAPPIHRLLYREPSPPQHFGDLERFGTQHRCLVGQADLAEMEIRIKSGGNRLSKTFHEFGTIAAFRECTRQTYAASGLSRTTRKCAPLDTARPGKMSPESLRVRTFHE